MAQSATAKQIAFLQGKGYNVDNIDFDEARAILDFWATHNWNVPNGLECPAYNPDGRVPPEAPSQAAAQNRRPSAAQAAAAPQSRRPATAAPQGAPARQPQQQQAAPPQSQRDGNGPATEKQVAVLNKYGYDTAGITFGEASTLLDELKNNNWQVPVAAAATEDAPFGP